MKIKPMSIKKSEVPIQRIQLIPSNFLLRLIIGVIFLLYSLVGTTNVVKIFGSANLFLHISKRFYIFADVGKG